MRREVRVPVSLIPKAIAQHLRDISERMYICDGVDPIAMEFLKLILQNEADELVR